MFFIDLFSGIGGFRLGLERAGHTCVAFCEIDKYARQTYKANFDTEKETEWQVLNSKDFGVPQNRERVFIVGHLRGEGTRQVFPITKASEDYIRKYKEINKNNLCTITLTKPRGPGSTKQYYIKEFNKNISSCLASRDYKGLREGMTCVMKNKDNNTRIRRLTPLEYFRLQGFSDDFYYNAKNNGVSDTQLYKQAGNSVTVNVIKEVAKNFKE